MKIYRTEQQSQEWLDARRGKVMGSKVKGVRRQARNSDKRYQTFWDIIAEKMSIAPDGENPMDRGHRVEPDALAAAGQILGVEFDPEPGMWISDIDDDIGVSPDGAEMVEEGQLPTFGAEVKSLSSGNHLRFIYEDRLAKKEPDYNPINSVPNEEKHYFRDQVIQYFVVNEKLEKMYFILYDDRIVVDHLVTYIIEVKRSDVAHLIEDNLNMQFEALMQINKIVAELSKEP